MWWLLNKNMKPLNDEIAVKYIYDNIERNNKMAGTEVVTITNMYMIYDGNRVVVQEKVDNDYNGVTFL